MCATILLSKTYIRFFEILGRAWNKKPFVLLLLMMNKFHQLKLPQPENANIHRN
mgnify:CR=1 FL=1